MTSLPNLQELVNMHVNYIVAKISDGSKKLVILADQFYYRPPGLPDMGLSMTSINSGMHV